jgi:uncharacterized protein
MQSRSRLQWLVTGLFALTLILGALPPLTTAQADTGIELVISQVYGGGGNTGAPYTHDFVEIFNRGDSPVSLDGLSIQYASATGTGNFGANSAQLTELPDVTLEPGQYFLVQQAGGTNGVPLPTPDYVDPTPIAMAAGSGKVVLATGTTSLGCNGGSTPCSPEQLARIIDLVGYGTANFFEGSGAAPTLSNTTAAFRLGDGCTDTDDNAADFFAAAPAPRNTSSPFNLCSASRVVISQIYGGGGNAGSTYTHDFVELFNRSSAPVSLAGWSIQYASATGTGNLGANAGQITELPDVTLEPGQYFLIQQAQGSGGTTPLPVPDVIDPTPINMSASAGKVALVNSQVSLGCNGGSTPCNEDQLELILDLVGYGNANFFEGSGAAPGLSNTTAGFRLNDGCVDTDNNAADFFAAPPAPRNSSSPNKNCFEPVNEPVVASCGLAISTLAGFSATGEVSASDTDGVVVDIAITDITPSPAPGAITITEFIPAAGTGDTATATVTVDEFVPPASYAVLITATNDDPEPQTGTCTLTVNVGELLTIGAVQGVVADTDSGTAHVSPYIGNRVYVQGVIYQKTLARSSAGNIQNGFFIQNTAEQADGDPNSSDGIFVFMGSFETLIGGYAPQVGDEVILSGNVTEFFNLTQLSSASAFQVIRSDVDLDAELPAFEVDPPADLQEAYRYWERREGMRARIPADSLAVAGLDIFPSTLDSEAWFIRGDSEIAQRDDPYTRRVFRDAHPLDDIPEEIFDNGNGYRFLIGGFGVKAALGDSTALLAPVRTFDTLLNSPVGGVYYSFGKYQVMVGEQLELERGADPSLNAAPQDYDRSQEYSIAVFNVENLYDYRDDPFDGCDFVGNAGCPGVTPPFNYVPESDEVYQARLVALARQIMDDLHHPDILLLQEVEDQDICIVVSFELVCGDVNNADGKPDTVQELATVIYSLGGPWYEAAYDRDGADARGIVQAYMYRAERVELLPASPGDPVLGSLPLVEYRSDGLPYNSDVQNPKALNAVLPDDVDTGTGVDGSNVFTRAPQVGLFRLWRTEVNASVYTDLYLLNNHFSSTPDARVGQRTEQAAYNAAIVMAIQAADPEAYVLVGGDFNVYPRPDDPFAPGHPRYPSDQLGPLYNIGLVNLYDFLLVEEPASAYSYVFQGQAQTLDQLFTTTSTLSEFVTFRVAHVNSDYSGIDELEPFRGASDHDPLSGRYVFLPNLDRLVELLLYFDAMGDITGRNTTRILLNHLQLAAELYEKGIYEGYADQVMAFINQVADFTPRFITPAASQALQNEGWYLLSSK